MKKRLLNLTLDTLLITALIFSTVVPAASVSQNSAPASAVAGEAEPDTEDASDKADQPVAAEWQNAAADADVSCENDPDMSDEPGEAAILEEETELSAETLDNAFTVSGTTITLTDLCKTQFYQCMIEACNEAQAMTSVANPVTITMPKGDYTLTNIIRLRPNTILDLNGSTITAPASGNLFVLFTEKGVDLATGYSGFDCLTIKNGTIKGDSSNTSTLINLSHGKNLTIENMTFIGGASDHMLELAAIDGLTIKNCTFKDFGSAKGRKNQEAVQLDIPCSEDVLKYSAEDGTTLKNVTVTGCTFQDGPRGIGTHTQLLGAYHENIKITGNTFKNITGEPIVALNYKNCEITNNTIEQCGAGIVVQNFKKETKSIYSTILNGGKAYSGKLETDMNTTITGNKIKVIYTGEADETAAINVSGRILAAAAKGADDKTIKAGEYAIAGVTIKDNTIVTAGHGIHLIDTHDSLVENNSISVENVSSKDSYSKKYDGIIAEAGCKEIDITGNQVKKPVRNGIYAQNNAQIKSINGNTIESPSGYGIGLFQDTKAGIISGNKITSGKNHGIMISTNASCDDIEGNTIDISSGKCTIQIYKNSSAGSISKNTLTGAKGSSILITTKSTVKQKISGNKIKKSGSNAINILSIKNNLEISGNVISGVGANAISVHPVSGKFAYTVNNNTITASKKVCGIYMFSGTAYIWGNKVTSANQAIHTEKGMKGSVYANTFSKVSKKVAINKNQYVTPGTAAACSISSAASSSAGKVVVKFKPAKGAAGYDVQISTDPAFKTDTLVKNAKKNASSLTVKGLESGKTYYVRVCSYKLQKSMHVCGKFSKTKQVSCK